MDRGVKNIYDVLFWHGSRRIWTTNTLATQWNTEMKSWITSTTIMVEPRPPCRQGPGRCLFHTTVGFTPALRVGSRESVVSPNERRFSVCNLVEVADWRLKGNPVFQSSQPKLLINGRYALALSLALKWSVFLSMAPQRLLIISSLAWARRRN